MKIITKIAMSAAAFLISFGAIAQGKSGAHANKNAKTHIKTTKHTSTSGKTVRESARVNGSLKANAHANAKAQENANENSVLNGTSTTTVKVKRDNRGNAYGETKRKTKSENGKYKTKKAKKVRTSDNDD